MEDFSKNISVENSIIIRELEELYRTNFKETETVEFKKSISELDSALKTICAFLNNKGGTIYFGISNSGNIIGQVLNDQNLREISQKIRDKIKPQITPKIETSYIKNLPVIEITVKKASDNIYYYNGVAFNRSATETVIMPPDEIKRRILEANQITWERQIFKRAKIFDLNMETIDKFLNLALKAKRLPETEDDKETILKKLELITDEGITNAAVVLFGKESARYFENTLLRCGRFKDEWKEFFFDMKDYGVNIFENLEKGINFIQEHIKITARIEGMLRVEKWELPIPALREAIINAMIHMDYTIGGYVYIAIYDDKIKISNPGYLMKGLKIRDLYKEHISIHRNKLIATILYLSGQIDNWGRGTLNIIKEMEKEELQLPKFKESNSYFHIVFNRPKDLEEKLTRKTPKLSINPFATKNVGINVANNVANNVAKNVAKKERLEIILEKLKKNIIFSKRSLASELNVDRKTIERDLEILKQQNKIIFIGSKKSGSWKIIN
jgi:ATP-dependent DNA helicase RecG